MDSKSRSLNTYVILNLLIVLVAFVLSERESCYDLNTGKAVRCYPEFINAAHSQPVIVTNTCGELESEFCVQTNIYASNDYGDNRLSKCDVCDAKRRDKSHPAEFLTDYNVKSNLTWWQSDTMEYNIQHPNTINLTLHLGKSFDITYVQVKFYSPRPESFSIQKRTTEMSEWQPYQFYSSNCESMYGVATRGVVTKENETAALCTDEYSDIAPLSGGSVAFSTLEGRPSAYKFETSDELKEWVTATDIKISLNRLNTFGDEVFGDPKVLRSYFYAISDISIGARCKCNGHANECTRDLMDSNFEEKFRCRCEHNTDGVDCEKCAPFYNDRPWAAATRDDANECLPCNCNGLSDKCVFNRTLYDSTNHGGYCIECQRNTDGPHCEYCKFSFYRRELNNECIDCGCHRDGSLSAQCDPMGKCKCKPGVTGDKCDRCLPNHYELSSDGCKKCECSLVGSFDEPAVCDSRNGQCRCKQNVEGRNCDRCKPGFFNLDGNLTVGCLPCFCFGHSAECKSSTNHFEVNLESSVNLKNLNEWTASDAEGRSVYVGSDESDSNGIFVFSQEKDVWFNAPASHLGDLRTSYNQRLTFFLKFTQSKSSMTRQDVILANSQVNLLISRSFYDQFSMASSQPDYFGQIDHEFEFTLSERDQWRPTLTARDFQRLLSNLTSIRIKCSLGGYTFLKAFKMKTAKPIKEVEQNGDLKSASWIEQCKCPTGHTGQFCEQCAHGYRREIIGGDAFVKCVPCQCNGHSLGGGCDQLTGKCDCGQHTIGENCELCQDGFYGDALQGTPHDCKKCPCPNDGPCAEFFNYQSQSVDVVCLGCPLGTRGNLCDICEDGWRQSSIDASKCEKCLCNGNIDENAVGNCDQVSGECLRCVHNTTGSQCNRCLDSYWGNALSDLKCHACECSPVGSNNPDKCKLDDGQCECKPNVIGRQCDECRPGYWNLTSGLGCIECGCNPLGSLNLICHPVSSQCPCRPGVTGLKCDQCLPLHYNFSSEGCQKCKCDTRGSQSQQCDLVTGKCECRSSAFGGNRCDKCAENYYNFTIGCQPCEECYGLVQIGVGKMRERIETLENGLEKMVADTVTEEAKQKSRELENNLKKIKADVNQLHKELFEDKQLNETYKASIEHLNDSISRINSDLKKLHRPFDIFTLKLEEVLPIEAKLNKSFGNIDLMNTMNGISQRKIQGLWEGIKKTHQEQPQTEKSKNQMRLTELAKSGRTSANKQLELVKKQKNELDVCIAESNKAMEHLNDILLKPPLRLAQMESEIDYELMIDTTQKLAADAKKLKAEMDKQFNEAEKAHKNLREITLKEGDIDKEMKNAHEKYKDIGDTVQKVRTNGEELNAKTVQFNESSEGAFMNAERVLNLAKVKDGDMVQLLERSQRIRNRSSDAKQMGEDAHRNASKTLEILENFNASLNVQKERAFEAKKLEPLISGNLEETKSIYFNLTNRLELAKADVGQVANNVIVLSQQIGNANKSLDRLKSESEELHNKSSNLAKELADLVNTHDDHKESIGAHASKYDEIPSRLNKLQTQSEEVLKKSQTLFSNVNNAEETVDSLKNVNLGQNRITRGEVERLEKQYAEVARTLDSMPDVDLQLKDLADRYETSRQELESYERELPKLKQSVSDLTNLLSTMNCKGRI